MPRKKWLNDNLNDHYGLVVSQGRGFDVTKDLLFAAAVVSAFSVTSAQDLSSAQSASATRPKFEAASIKECKPGDPSPPPEISSPGRLRLNCWPLTRLIAEAYETFANGRVDPLKPPFGIPPDGAPNWANSAHYTIDAKAEGPQSGAMMRGPMMQALLEDGSRPRFIARPGRFRVMS